MKITDSPAIAGKLIIFPILSVPGIALFVGGKTVKENSRIVRELELLLCRVA